MLARARRSKFEVTAANRKAAYIDVKASFLIGPQTCLSGVRRKLCMDSIEVASATTIVVPLTSHSLHIGPCRLHFTLVLARRALSSQEHWLSASLSLVHHTSCLVLSTRNNSRTPLKDPMDSLSRGVGEESRLWTSLAQREMLQSPMMR